MLINDDRIDGYERALHELKASDLDLKTLFLNMIAESRVIKNSLAAEVLSLGGEVEKGTRGMGKFIVHGLK